MVAEAVATEPTASQATPEPQPAVPAAAPAAPVATPVSGGTVAFKFDAKRWSQADRLAGGATLVLLISLFLPWFNWSISSVGYSVSWSPSGLSSHGFLYIVLIICLVVLAYLGLRAGYEQMPFKLPLAHEPLILIATLVNLVLVLIGFLDKPSVILVGVGWDFGAFLALVAAVVAAAPLGIPAIKARTSSAK